MKAGGVVNALKRRADVSKGQTLQEKVFFIFNSPGIVEGADSFVPRCIGNMPIPGFTPKIMRINYYL